LILIIFYTTYYCIKKFHKQNGRLFNKKEYNKFSINAIFYSVVVKLFIASTIFITFFSYTAIEKYGSSALEICSALWALFQNHIMTISIVIFVIFLIMAIFIRASIDMNLIKIYKKILTYEKV